MVEIMTAPVKTLTPFMLVRISISERKGAAD